MSPTDPILTDRGPRKGFFIRFSDRVRRSLDGDNEDGLSIIEVLVAFTLLAVVTLGTVPLFISGLRGTFVARLDTAAKNITQERFELMRNLPYHIAVTGTAVPGSCSNPAVTSTAGGCDFRDMLDTYYRSLTPAPSVSQSGYVVPGGARSSDEPTTGAFYRFVINPVAGFDNRYRQTVATQFIELDRTPVTPPTGYNSQVSGSDTPPSKLVGVTVITQWVAGGTPKKLVNFSQITEGIALPPKVTTQARATAVRVTTSLNSSRTLSVEAGISNADGASSSGTTAATSAQSFFARINPGASIEGIQSSFSAPSNVSNTTGTTGLQVLTISGGTVVAEVIGGAVANVNATTASELPKVATSASPSTGQVSKAASGAISFRVNNTTSTDSIPLTMPGVLHGTSKVQVVEDALANFPARGTTFLDATSGSGHFAEAEATSHSQTVRLLETAFAPQGLVQARLNSSSINCRSTGSTLSVSAPFSGTVRYLQATTTPGLNAYVDVPITKPATGAATATLDPGLLDTAEVWSSAATKTLLRNYISSWGSLVTATVGTNVPEKSITASMNGIITIATQPLRTGDVSSSITLALGNLSCHAQDTR